MICLAKPEKSDLVNAINTPCYDVEISNLLINLRCSSCYSATIKFRVYVFLYKFMNHRSLINFTVNLWLHKFMLHSSVKFGACFCLVYNMC